MIRKIIKIDEEKCTGCGLCIEACHEGAIGIVDGKARLLRDDYCDGLGNCLPVCPTGAISFEEREAEEYDEASINKNARVYDAKEDRLPCGCPGTQSKTIRREVGHGTAYDDDYGCGTDCATGKEGNKSRLSQWPVQIKLAPVNASYFSGANLLIAADCAAYAHGDFHNSFIRNRITLIGCPKLDNEDYSEKLTAIIRNNNIRSVTVVRMEVPCCGGIEYAVKKALKDSGKFIPWQIVTISTDGEILE